MKKIIILLGIILLVYIWHQYKTEITLSQNNTKTKELPQNTTVKWDKKKSLYINEIHGITWYFPQYMEWEERPILDQSTILKIRDDNYYILVTINVNRATSCNLDAWESINNLFDDFFDPEYRQNIRKIELLTETEHISTKATKELICGIHTRKIITEYKIKQSDFPDGFYRLAYQYQLGNGENIYTFGITGLYLQKNEYQAFDKTARDIINGLIIKEF